jgi:hypothetical protein
LVVCYGFWNIHNWWFFDSKILKNQNKWFFIYSNNCTALLWYEHAMWRKNDCGNKTECVLNHNNIPTTCTHFRLFTFSGIWVGIAVPVQFFFHFFILKFWKKLTQKKSKISWLLCRKTNSKYYKYIYMMIINFMIFNVYTCHYLG